MVELREHEQKTLLALQKLGGKAPVDEVVKASGLAHAAVMRAALSLTAKKLAQTHERKQTVIKLNEEGKQYAKKKLPERHLIDSLVKLGGKAPIEKVAENAHLAKKFIPIALGWLQRKGWATIEDKERVLKALKRKPAEGTDEKLISFLNEKSSFIVEKLSKNLQSAVAVLRGRKLVEIRDKMLREIELTSVGQKLVKKQLLIVEEVSQLKPELIVSGKWRQVRLRKYNIEAPVAVTWSGKKHPYARFLDELKEKLVALGFKEMRGPLIELSFFNFDSLYTPQDHPAREIFGVYYVKSPKYGKVDTYKPAVENVKKTHETGWKTGSTGWGYHFSLRDTQRLLLRAHGTALSVRTLLSKDLEIPGKYFAVARCYRPDMVDKTHLSEFNQVEGIIAGEDLTLRDLLGVLERFAIDIAGVDKVKFRPDYFPFTEPSVELVAYKKDYGWLEFGGSGIFRPEVTLPLGVKVPVLAWGLGVDRLFMMKAGIDDIRHLFSQDLDWIRRKELT
ncbi:MAG: phenylalanine--tRNA ligase subunit alpha [Candidatus Bathyarchaeota archaeon]|nr:MAG: phenylalanine--tRNA ligase subunit alpha [Candidatus Bathyarchaeota archaeon]